MENPIDDAREPLNDTEATARPAGEAPAYPPYARTQAPLPPLPGPAPGPGYYPAPPTQAKGPLLALLLSVFPGLGQLYNEQPAKAVTFFFFMVGSIYGTAFISPFRAERHMVRRMMAEGVRAPFRPEFPSKTFPNHYSMATGLTPGQHGIVVN